MHSLILFLVKNSHAEHLQSYTENSFAFPESKTLYDGIWRFWLLRDQNKLITCHDHRRGDSPLPHEDLTPAATTWQLSGSWAAVSDVRRRSEIFWEIFKSHTSCISGTPLIGLSYLQIVTKLTRSWLREHDTWHVHYPCIPPHYVLQTDAADCFCRLVLQEFNSFNNIKH